MAIQTITNATTTSHSVRLLIHTVSHIFMVNHRSNSLKLQYTMLTHRNKGMQVLDHINHNSMAVTRRRIVMQDLQLSQCKEWYLASP